MKAKNLLTVSTLAIFLLSGISTNLLSQTVWDKSTNSPILNIGDAGEWDDHSVYEPKVIYHKSPYKVKMFYTGRHEDIYQVGYATSVDGENWQKYGANPIIPAGKPGAWDRNRAPGCVLEIDDVLHMWYQTWTPGQTNYSIAYAWSLNGYDWNLSKSPVLEAGQDGDWDDEYVYGPSVYFDGLLYHMWYTGSEDGVHDKIGYAKSPNGTYWLKCPENPVVGLGENGTFNDDGVFFPSVIYDNEKFKMWFSGNDGANTRIGYAESENAMDWSVLPYSVIDLGESTSWDRWSVTTPCVVKREDTYKMWFGGATLWHARIGYAEGKEVLNVPDDFGNIQEGVDAAENGEVVLISPGTYYDNIDFKGKAITIASRYAITGDENDIINTIIDGSQSKDADKNSVIYFTSGEDTNSVIKGFTITGGGGTASTWGEGSISGGGIFCEGSSPKIEHNIIINNHCIANGFAAGGGGIYANTSSKGPIIIRHNTISDNSIINNATGESYVFGGGLGIDCDAIITDNIVNNNYVFHAANGQALGGGIQVWQSKVIVKNNVISGNIVKKNGYAYIPWGGGLFGQQLSTGSVVSENIIKNNKIDGSNSKGGGIAIWRCNSNFKIDKNIILNNEARDGGGMAIGYDHKTIITNNVIQFNYALSYGGGIYVRELPELKVRENNFRSIETGQITPIGYDHTIGLMCIIANNTIYKNHSDNYGGGIGVYWSGNYFLAFNNIIHGNTSLYFESPMHLNYNSNAYLFHNDINILTIRGPGNYIEDGSNIYEEPEIVDESGHLSWYSPCVNAGVSTIKIDDILYHAPSTDIDGEKRPYLNTTPDIGADETQSIFVQVPDNIVEEEIELNAFPNPFSDNIGFSFSVSDNSFVSFTIIDNQGKLINTLVNEMRLPGDYQLYFDGTTLPPGIYLGILRIATKTHTTKFIKLK